MAEKSEISKVWDLLTGKRKPEAEVAVSKKTIASIIAIVILIFALLTITLLITKEVGK